MGNVIKKLRSGFSNETVGSPVPKSLPTQPGIVRDGSIQVGIDAHFMVSTIDANGNLIGVNDKFVGISGYERSELVGQSYGFLRSSEYSESFWQEILETLKKGEV